MLLTSSRKCADKQEEAGEEQRQRSSVHHPSASWGRLQVTRLPTRPNKSLAQCEAWEGITLKAPTHQRAHCSQECNLLLCKHPESLDFILKSGRLAR